MLANRYIIPRGQNQTQNLLSKDENYKLVRNFLPAERDKLDILYAAGDRVKIQNPEFTIFITFDSYITENKHRSNELNSAGEDLSNTICKKVAGLLNSMDPFAKKQRWGAIYVGVNPSRRVQVVKISRKARDIFQQVLSRKLRIRLTPGVSVTDYSLLMPKVQIDGRTSKNSRIIIVLVRPNKLDNIHCFLGKIYMCKYSQVVERSLKDMRETIRQRETNRVRLYATTANDALVEKFVQDALKQAEQMLRSHGNPVTREMTYETLLQGELFEVEGGEKNGRWASSLAEKVSESKEDTDPITTGVQYTTSPFIEGVDTHESSQEAFTQNFADKKSTTADIPEKIATPCATDSRLTLTDSLNTLNSNKPNTLENEQEIKSTTTSTNQSEASPKWPITSVPTQPQEVSPSPTGQADQDIPNCNRFRQETPEQPCQTSQHAFAQDKRTIIRSSSAKFRSGTLPGASSISSKRHTTHLYRSRSFTTLPISLLPQNNKDRQNDREFPLSTICHTRGKAPANAAETLPARESPSRDSLTESRKEIGDSYRVQKYMWRINKGERRLQIVKVTDGSQRRYGLESAMENSIKTCT